MFRYGLLEWLPENREASSPLCWQELSGAAAGGGLGVAHRATVIVFDGSEGAGSHARHGWG